MAGLGFKDFAVGEVLTAADVDGYLMQQSVMRFADAGARGSALGTATGTGVPLAEGMISYLDDANRIEFYSGTVWTGVGKVLQVVNATKTDSFSTTSTSFVDVTGLSVSITPTATSSNILVLAHIALTNSDASDNHEAIARVVRGATQLGIVALTDNGGIRQADGYGSVFLDSPSTTSATTYKWQARATFTTAYVNRSVVNTSGYTSSITAIEVAA